ncbi:integrase (phage-encoded) [Paracholeplasma brassicae]|uniref:Integrase (Phage-encoded) n=1 Tax=Acholeplasma brassicae TaxID=61635 RepID=U4KPX4_9MOLU|nr:site-specific integrase [Paracholeplasma brassicae]CCV66440.1 integrase (phage-encoded) [Paracholeplasma brassicae]
MTIQELVNNQLSNIRLNQSKRPYKHYQAHLMHFKKWCDNNLIHNTDDIDELRLIDYINELKETCQNITINKRIGILKRTYITSGINFDFLHSINKFKETRTTFDMVEIDDIKRIRKHLISLSDDSNNLTIKCLVLLLIDTGCRASELINIEKKNVNIDTQEVLLTRTKTKQNRVVYFNQTTCKEIKKMIGIKTNHKYLIHNIANDRTINYFDIDWTMKYLKKTLNIEKLHAHMFRHTLASILLENGADIKSVQEILGHSNLETTQRYIHSRKDHVKKTFFKNFNVDK